MRTSSLLAASGGVALVLGAAAPAVAGEQPQVDQWKVLRENAGISWVVEDHDDTSGRPGNVHTGGMLVDKAYGIADLFGYLVDWDCEPGRVPWDREPAGCVLLTQYEIASAGAVFEVDARTGTATLTGEVALFDLEMEAPEGRLDVDVRWTSDGTAVRTGAHHRDLSPTTKSIVHERALTWNGLGAEGVLGSLVLGDEPGEITEADLWVEDGRYFLWQRGSDVPPDDDGGGGMG